MDDYALRCFSAGKAIALESGVEVRCGAGVFTGSGAVAAVGGIELAGFLGEGGFTEAALVQEMGEPVVFALILADGFLHTGGQIQLELSGDDLLGSLDDPGEDGAGGMIEELPGIILAVGGALDLRLEGDDDETTPDAYVLGSHLGQVIGIEDQGMAGIEVKGGAVLGFALDLIRGAELLDHGLHKMMV